MDEAAPRDPIWTPRLLGLTNRRLDLTLTLVAVVLLAASRFLLLANGPWEQDEAIFARSVLEFAPKQHFPHPPFFPGWMALGFLLTPMVGEPLRAFQLASAATSLLCLWPLAALGRRAATPALAFVCALAVQFLPGPWVFAVRGFSDTAASFLALLAAAMLLQGLPGERFLAFSGVIAASFLVRPVLVPVLMVLWLVGAWRVRPRRLALAGGAIGILMTMVGFEPFAAAAGGLGEFVRLFAAHGEEHFGAVEDTATTLGGLGMVVSFGGIAATAVAVVVMLAGLVVWGRRQGWRQACLYAATITMLVLMLLFAHVPTFPRYSVPLVLAATPLAAAALSWLPAVAGIVTALAVAVLSGCVWLPLLIEQHTTRFPMWAAAVTACETAREAPTPTQVLAGRGGWAFAAYFDSLMRRGGAFAAAPRAARWAPPYSAATSAPHWLVVAGWYRDVLPWAGAREVASFSGVSAKAERMSQHRFLTGFVVADLALQRGTWWPPEKDGSGRTFAWCSKGTALVLPAVAAGDHLSLMVRAARGDKPLKVNVNRNVSFTVPGNGKVLSHRVPPEALLTDRSNTVFFERAQTYPPNARDPRPLAAAVYSVAVARADRFEVSLGDAARLDELGVAIEGFFGRETFRNGVVGRWSEPKAWIEMPASAGTVALTLLAPRPAEARVEIFVDATRVAGPWVVPTVPSNYSFELPPAAAAKDSVRLEFRVTPYATPALPGRPSRSLGVVVSSLSVVPKP
jgi:hypothetical protein